MTTGSRVEFFYTEEVILATVLVAVAANFIKSFEPARLNNSVV